MSIVSFKQKGDFKNTEKLLKRSFGKDYKSILEKYALQGVRELAANTPIDTGLTASSWTYDIVQTGSSYSIVWNNSNVNKGVNIAVILQYGHATRNGGYVQGRDYINPALQPIFDEMAEAAWKEVTSV
jgi:hypothetical protein